MIDVTWYNDHQDIILWKMCGRWTLSEYNRAVDETSSMMASVQHRVDVIGELSNCINMPPNIIHTVSNHYREIAQRDSNYGISVLVSANRMLKVVGKALNQLPYSHKRFHFVETMVEAEQAIHEHRAAA